MEFNIIYTTTVAKKFYKNYIIFPHWRISSTLCLKQILYLSLQKLFKYLYLKLKSFFSSV